MIGGALTSRRKNPKRNIKSSSRAAGQTSDVKKVPVVIGEKRRNDLADEKVVIGPVFKEEDKQSNKKQILWKTENLEHLELNKATIRDFKDETFEKNDSESEGDSNVEIKTSTDISKIENIDKFAKVIEANDDEGNVRRTVIIKNIPGALRLFGIKNVPKKIFQKHRNSVPVRTKTVEHEEPELNLTEEITKVFDINRQMAGQDISHGSANQGSVNHEDSADVKTSKLVDRNDSDKKDEIIKLLDLRKLSELETETSPEKIINDIKTVPREHGDNVDDKNSIGDIVESDNEDPSEIEVL